MRVPTLQSVPRFMIAGVRRAIVAALVSIADAHPRQAAPLAGLEAVVNSAQAAACAQRRLRSHARLSSATAVRVRQLENAAHSSEGGR